MFPLTTTPRTSINHTVAPDDILGSPATPRSLVHNSEEEILDTQAREISRSQTSTATDANLYILETELDLDTRESIDNRGQANDEVLVWNPKPPTTFENCRYHLRIICDSKPFTAFIVSLILANTITLALDSPSASQELKDVLEIFELVFLILFTIEMILKMLAFGFFGKEPRGYFRNGWNWLDFFIVVLGWFTFALDRGNVSALRAMRVFRILKAVGKIGSFQILLESLGRSFPAMVHVFTLLAFFMVTFSIVGVQLFVGVLNRRCYIPTESGNSTYYQLDEEQESRCTTSGSALIFTGWPCNAGTICLEPSTFPLSGCENATECWYIEPVLSWDNSFKALLMSTKIGSLDDWPTDQENVQDGLANITWIFFWCIIILGSLFAINLLLAVQCDEFVKVANDQRERVDSPRSNATWRNRLFNRFRAWRNKPTLRGPFQQKVYELVVWQPFRLFVLIVIVINVAFLAADYYEAPDALTTTIFCVNIVCTAVFIIEAAMKIFGFGIREYFGEATNCADFVLVVLAIVELCLSGNSSISALRAFWLVRLLRYARHARTLQKIAAALGRSLKEMLTMSLLLMIFVTIFTILGMQLYGPDGIRSDDPRFSFQSLWESFYTVFIVITGESWATIMSLTIQETSWASAFYFLAVFCIGNYILVNLFICIIVDALASYSDSEPQDETQKSHDVAPPITATDSGSDSNSQRSSLNEDEQCTEPQLSRRDTIQSVGHFCDGYDRSHTPHDRKATLVDMTELYFLEDRARRVEELQSPRPLHLQNDGCRGSVESLLKHHLFKWFVVAMIVLNAGFLCFETPWTTDNCIKEVCDTWSLTLYIANIVFVVVFVVELVLNLIGLGFKEYVGYWQDGRWHGHWGNLFDVLVVLASVIGLFVPSLKVFRSFRVLRLVTRIERIRVVITALWRSLPVLSNVVVVLCFIWFLFGLLGVQLMMGRFWACTDTDTGEATALDRVDCVGGTLSWERPRWDFDNILVALGTLTIVALGEGWASVMWQAIDSTGENTAPQQNASPWLGLYFVTFVVFGGFLALNLFVGTLIDAFMENSGSVTLLTDRQRAFVRAMRVMLKAKLPQVVQPPRGRLRRALFTLVQSVAFEAAMMVLIILNIIFFSLEYYNQPDDWASMLSVANYSFVGIFTLEALFKILLGLGPEAIHC